MALPVSWTTVPVTATYTLSTGERASGVIVFTADPIVVIGGEIIVPEPIVASLDDGVLAVDLPATDDPDLSPGGWTWTVTEKLSGELKPLRKPWALRVPHDADSIDLGAVTPSVPVTKVTPYAGLDVENVFTKSQMLRSSFAGGEDDGSPESFDSTSRLNLESYQRASTRRYGETVRHYARRKDSKQMVAYYFPEGGYDENREPVGDFVPVVWHGAHWESNNHDGNHKHWSIETPDPTGAIQTRFEVRFGDQDVDDAVAGLDKTQIMTNLADFIVRCSNGQVLRLSGDTDTHKDIEYSLDHEGGSQFRRWALRMSGGTDDFHLVRYDSTGAYHGPAIAVKNGNGRVGIGTNDPTGQLDIDADAIRVRQSQTPATATTFGQTGEIAWDANYVYVCVAPSTWKRAALEGGW